MEQDYRPSKDLKDVVAVRRGTTTSAGNAGGTTLIDSGLTQADDYWNNMAVVILSGNSNGQIRRISGFANATGTITVDTAFASQIASGTQYAIVAQHLSLSSNSTDVGVRQVLEVSVTSAANAGATIIGTVNNQACVIEYVIIHADTGQTADLVSCPVTAGASNVLTIVDATRASQANLNTADKQVSEAYNNGGIRLAAGKTIVMTLNGNGATAVDLTVIIAYHSSSGNGGTIT